GRGMVSAFASPTLRPVMCSFFLGRHSKHEQGRLNLAAERFFDAMIKGYDRGLIWVLNHQPLMLLVTLGLIVFTGYLYTAIPKGFFPQQDTGFVFGQAEARQHISF